MSKWLVVGHWFENVRYQTVIISPERGSFVGYGMQRLVIKYE